MAYPPAYERTFSFSEWETLHPGEPKPGADLDTEFDDVSVALTATQDALALIQRDDGALANDSVGEDQLQDDVFEGIVDGITADAEAARDAAAAHAAAAATSATAADASADAASTSEDNAAGSAALAGTSQSIAQTAANDAAAAAAAAEVSATDAEIAANETAGSVAETQAAVDLAFKWAEYLAGPVMPAPDGWPEAVDDGMWSSKWWALKARDYSQLTQVDFGTSGAGDIGEAYDDWGGTLPPGNVIASWNGDEYWLVDPANPSDPASWVKITGDTGAPGAPGPANSLAIGTVTTLAPGSPATATITGTPPTQVLDLGIPQGATGSGGAGAGGDPTALVGLTAVNGVSTTLIRSDGAPALDQSIVPTWTGEHTFRARVFLNPDPQVIPAAAIHADARQVIADDGSVSSLMVAIGSFVSLGLRNMSAAGTFAVPTAVTVAAVNYMAFLGAGGFDGTNWQTGSAALIGIKPLDTWSGTQRPTRVVIETTPVGSVTRSVVASFSNAEIALTSTALTWNGAPIGASFANPTGTIGLAAVNGVATTAMRSDAAPALSQAIAPTWTDRHIFAKAGTLSSSTIELAGTRNNIMFRDIDNFTDAKNWVVEAEGSYFIIAAVNDAHSIANYIIEALRTGANVTTINLGNTTNNPVYNFLGTGLTTFGGTVGAPIFNATGSAPRIRITQTSAATNETQWDIAATGGDLYFRTRTDADGAGATWQRITRNALLISAIDTWAEGPISFSVNSGGTNVLQLDYSARVRIYEELTNMGVTRTLGFNTGALTYGTVYVSGAHSSYAGYGISDALQPIFMSNASNAGIYIVTDSKWILYRSSSSVATSNYNIDAVSFNATSARAIKRETGRPTRVRDILSRLRPILYRLLNDETREQLGMIAEEVHEICPQLSNGKTISYDRLAVLLLADWQEEHGFT